MGDRLQLEVSNLVRASSSPASDAYINLVMTKLHRQIQRGFTMVELITTMILIGILSAIAIPRMNLISGFDEIGYRDQVIATLEFARKSAVAQRRHVQVTRAGNALSFRVAKDIPEGPSATTFAGASGSDLLLPGSGLNYIEPRGSTTLGGLTGVVFDPLGRATLTGGVSLTVTGDSVATLTVDSGTGYVY